MAGGRPRHKKINEETQANTSDSLTPEEKAIFARVADTDKSWQTITEGDMEDFSLMEDPLKLQPEAEKKQREQKFAFRWASMKPQRIDQLRNAPVPLKWWLCNRSQTPFLSKYCDPIHGGIQRLDQILFFKPWWMHRAAQAAKQELADIQMNSGDLNKRDGQSIDETGSKFLAGEQHKITGSDEVMDPGNALEGVYAQERQVGTGSEDLVVEE